MAVRAVWKGTIGFGMVSINAQMFTSVDEGKVGFNQVHSGCGSKISYQKYCRTCEREVSNDEIKKGFPAFDENGNERFITFENGELENLKLKTVRQIEILEFVEPGKIDPRHLNKPYFLAPEWDSRRKAVVGAKQFVLFQKSLKETGLWALGKLVYHDRENLVLIRPYGNILLLHLLHYVEDLRDPEELETRLRNSRVVITDEELRLGKAIIQKFKGEADLTKYHDEYRDALNKLIEQKLSGQVVEIEEVKPVKEEEDLLSQLKASLEE